MRQYEKFSQYLATAISQTGLLKNEMIRNLEIDRSSYYQILKGSRLPTKGQYQELKRILLLPKEELMQLDDLYYRAVLGENIWEDILHVSSFIRLLSETSEAIPVSAQSADINSSPSEYLPDHTAQTDSGSSMSDMPQPVRYLQSRKEVEDGIREILLAAVSVKELDYYVPASADFFYRLLKQLISEVHEEIQIRQLAALPGGRVAERKEAVGIFRELLIFLSATRSNIHLECRYYYNSVSKISDIGLLYPWYILCGENVLMIDRDFRSAVFIRSEIIAEAFANQFTQAFLESTPLLKNYGSLEQNLRAIREFLKGKQEVNYEAIPCTAMIATPQMIRKYVIPQAQEELINHCEALQREETMIDIASISGLKQFLKSRKIPEIPETFMRPVETQDLIWYVDNLLDRIGTTLFLIDENRISSAYDWDLTIIKEYSVLIHHHNYDTMILDEKNIVDMFTSFAQNIQETPFVLETEKARKELLDIRSELIRSI